MSEMLTWLRATIEGDLATAQAATQGDWATFGHGGDDYRPYPAYQGEQTSRGHGWNISVADPAGPDVAAELRRADAEHVVAQQPRDAAARCEAELAILDEHAVTTTSAIGEDMRRVRVEVCQTCGDRSGVPCRTVRLLAQGYRHRPGWQEGWAP